jgi:hypothetical protein
MRARALTLALLLAFGCGRSWDLDQPMRVSVVSRELSAFAIAGYFESAVRQLGGTVSPLADQVVYVRYNAAADCNGCTPLTIEHVGYRDDTIQILPRIMAAPPDALDHAIAHGLGHVLGFEQHLPAGRRGVMMGRYDDVPAPKTRYTPDDFTALRSSRAVGGKL